MMFFSLTQGGEGGTPTALMVQDCICIIGSRMEEGTVTKGQRANPSISQGGS